MEIFMRNISYSATPVQIIRAIHEVLSTDSYVQYANGASLNFNISLFPDKKGRGAHIHSGCGALTLPTVEIGNRFLAEFGAGGVRPFVVSNRHVVFQKSNKEARQDVLQRIRETPYLDPQALEDKDKRMQQLQDSVSIKTIQFGWECRDGVFSVEWEKECVNRCELHFSTNERELRVKLQDGGVAKIVVIRFPHINWWAATRTSNTHAIFFSLQTPPTYESELILTPVEQLIGSGSRGGNSLNSLFFQLFGHGGVHDTSPRKRLVGLDDQHSRVAPYTSLAIRLVCSTATDLATFKHLSGVAHLKDSSDFDYPIESRQLFCYAALRELEHWLRSLDWNVAVQVEALTRSLVLDVKEMLSLRSDIEQVSHRRGPQHATTVLRHFANQARELPWNSGGLSRPSETIRDCFLRSEKECLSGTQSFLRRNLDDNVFDCLHVTVTPTSMFLDGPMPERSNRVMRRYPDHHHCFLRVTFADENRLQYRFNREVDGREFIQKRVGGIMHNGLVVAGRNFEFLAYSQSALKEHSVWFVTPFHHPEHGLVDAASIIASLGSFKDLTFDRKLIYCPARYGARISQAFTATDASVTVEPEEILAIADVERSGWCFTDGVGTCSRSLAEDVWVAMNANGKRKKRRRIQLTPPAFQIRFQGSKGMLSLDHRLSGRAICIRPSMIKFEAPQTLVIEIARAFDKPGSYYLNRPLIMLLEGLGVPYETFREHQDAAVHEANEAVKSLRSAARLLESHGLGASYRLTSVLMSLAKLGVERLSDKFYEQMMEFAVNHVLRDLKHHARIPVPGGWTLVGVADVHSYLREGEIFACIQEPDKSKPIWLEGDVLISRSPTIHPGDVQVVTAIGKPPPDSPFFREALLNTVVFSIQGSRPLPSYLGGGDLDGDTYNLIQLSTLPKFRPERLSSPASYAPAEKKLLDRPSTMTDVADFFVEYINSDVLGIIAINWLIIADQSSIFDKDCIALANLHSDAVDYPKSGRPVPIQTIPKPKLRTKPDWNAPETAPSTTAEYYQSLRAIGRLFRAIDLPAVRMLPERARTERRQFDEDEELSLDEIMAQLQISDDPSEEDVCAAIRTRISQFVRVRKIDPKLARSAAQLFRAYSYDFRSICVTNTLSPSRSAILTEEEAVIGTIVAKSSQPRQRKDLMSKLREQTALLVSGIREELSGDDDSLKHWLRRAWMAWEVSLVERDSFGARSFGWIALGGIFEAIRAIEEEEKNA